MLGAKHTNTLMSISNLGLVLKRQGKYKEAEAMHQQVLVARDKVLGAKHPNMLISANNFCLVLDSQGKYKEAEVMHQ